MSFYATTFQVVDERPYPEEREFLLKVAKFTNPAPNKEHCIFSLESGKIWDAGIFSTPSVEELRAAVDAELANDEVKQKLSELRAALGDRPIVQLQNLVGESRELHSDPLNRYSVIQAASQFNYLEFPSPMVVPENGITGYMYDRTQGPACAIACAAGTAYRNYLAKVGNAEERGQTKDRQFDGLEDVTKALGDSPFYTVRNGYVESTKELLDQLNARLEGDATLPDRLSSLLRIGVQEDTQVTDEEAGTKLERQGDGQWKRVSIDDQPYIVTQTYNSALSIGYSRLQSPYGGAGPWDNFAKIVLNGSYEATMLIAVLNVLKRLRATSPAAISSSIPRTLLTKVGGGVFANNAQWIKDAIRRSCAAVKDYGVPLNVYIVHFRDIEYGYEELATTS